MALRSLLHSAEGSQLEVITAGAMPEDLLMGEAAQHSSTLDLRIASVFVILFGAVLFGLPTLLFKQFQSPDAVVPRLLRAFAGGVILALALVHIIPEAVEDLHSLIEFPVGGCTILFGIILLVIIDSSLAAFLAPKTYKDAINKDNNTNNHIHGSQSSQKTNKSLKNLSVIKDSACHTELVVVRATPDSPMIGAAKQHDLELQADHGSSSSTDENLPVLLPRVNSPPPHGHQCLNPLKGNGWLTSAETPVKTLRQYVTAYTMEMGCIFHSLIIGIGVGVITDDRHLVVDLMIALAVHQGLEALALGSVLAVTGFTKAKKLSMLLLYSLTTPIGIGVGIAISSTYDEESVTSKAVQGTLNGVSGGMLLYIGMYQLIAEEFSREDLLVKPRLRFGMYGGLCLGAALMCVLAVWA